MSTPSGSRHLLGTIAGCTATALIALTSQPSIAEPDRKLKPALTEAREKPLPNNARMARLEKERKAREWHTKMGNLPLHRDGCFKAKYPDLKWEEIPCVDRENIPFSPMAKDIPYNVGNGNNYSAQVSGQLISAEGSFDQLVTNGIMGRTFQSQFQDQPDAYSLQLNSNRFDSPACAASPNPANCKGWQQFAYSSISYGGIFIQHWLLNYRGSTPGNNCPSGWSPDNSNLAGDCYRTSSISPVPLIPAGSLAQTRLSATVESNANGSKGYRVDLASGTTRYALSVPDDYLSLAANWTDAEYAIVGDCCRHTAKFSGNTSIAVKLTVHNGTTNAPTCMLQGLTGEQNNLYLAATPAIGIQPSPTMVSNQASTNAPPASCVVAAGLGDIHIRTFPPAQQVTTSAASLAYDFQAEGEFILARTDMGFEVQTRQISGAPTWPNATLNQAIAAKIGNSVLVFSVADNNPKVFVDGTLVSLKDGERRVLPDDGDLIRHMDMYLARDMRGNSIQVYVQRAATHYLDVYVGLGRWPTYVKGLLASASDNAGAVEARKGKIFTAPFDFETFYQDYGDSWRVTNDESLFSQAKPQLPAVRASNPKQRFDASHLKPKIYLQAKKHCLSTGVKKQLLDDCILDVAVIGDKRAAQTYIHPQLRAGGERPRLFLAKDQFRAHPKQRKTLPGRPEVNQTLPDR
ncbi:hypothetical protein [Thauera sp. 2A1]|uniref:hypothetical protein n=1 Tax=Thauera sp. 2A1 TaxID=2570191 RepID=UPI0012927C32|nr:hypothetical protein [Thauera sp. 2A1]KAI5916452.1 hypothetical protein GH664_03150 [Thauera sp. 2A1]